MLQNESYVTKAPRRGKAAFAVWTVSGRSSSGRKADFFGGGFFASGESESGIEGKGQGCRLMVLALAHCHHHTHLSWR